MRAVRFKNNLENVFSSSGYINNYIKPLQDGLSQLKLDRYSKFGFWGRIDCRGVFPVDAPNTGLDKKVKCLWLPGGNSQIQTTHTHTHTISIVR